MLRDFRFQVFGQVEINLCQLCFFCIAVFISFQVISQLVGIIDSVERVLKIICLHNVFQPESSFRVQKWFSPVTVVGANTAKTNDLALAGRAGLGKESIVPCSAGSVSIQGFSRFFFATQ
jgi:hypothetical protein